ncbi:MAG: hypothetical protein MJB57_15315 [Gemmatimonadetes bacterium]|nr:hypothetical protein [Gemmatimonadota bacterium]
MAEDTDLLIFGSQAILGQYPDAPRSLRASVEVDVQPLNKPAAVDAIDGALGELSLFHQTHGFYVHGLTIDAATLPDGWESRTTRVSHEVGTRGNVGHCIEAHDLAVSKLVAFREKDRAYVRTLLAEGLLDVDTLSDRLRHTALDDDTRSRLTAWVDVTIEDLV